MDILLTALLRSLGFVAAFGLLRVRLISWSVRLSLGLCLTVAFVSASSAPGVVIHDVLRYFDGQFAALLRQYRWLLISFLASLSVLVLVQ